MEENNKYIYLLVKDNISGDEDTADVVYMVSTDFQKILDTIDIKDQFYDETILVLEENWRVDYCDSFSFYSNGCAEHFKKYHPHALSDDEKEIEYVYECLKLWNDARYKYFTEKKRKDDLNVQKMKEEKERKEYERLKKKFEKQP